MKLSNNDIQIQDGGTHCYFRFLAWDSDFFGKPCYVLDTDKSTLGCSQTIADQITGTFSKSFITAKFDTTIDNNIIHFFEQSGFHYIDTEITLEYQSCQQSVTNCQDITVCQLDSNVDLPYEELGSVYSLTRFHTDPNISTKKADQLWVEYIKNYKPGPEHSLFIAKVADQVVGAILANQGDFQLHLFFVSTIPDHQSKGVGSLLLSKTIEALKPKNLPIFTGTQAKNIWALNFYIRNGFSKIKTTKTVMHFHGDAH